jgi:acetoin utilization deacetylase AcuC-like enzyme
MAMPIDDRVLLISDPAMIDHDPGSGHPERPERLRAILEDLREQPVQGASFAKPQAATRAAIERIHSSQYIDQIDALRGKSARLDADTAVSPASVDAAYLAAGTAIMAVEAVIDGTSQGAFALVRPPGHHAERDRAMGFCLFNNMAIAAAHAIAQRGCRRVLIVDWDVHHGNGTQHAFEDRRDVLVFNTHQHRLFPDTGELNESGRGEGEGFTVNCPLPPGMNDATYLAIFQRVLIPIADQYRPDLVLVSAGFDGHRDDPLGGMALTDEGFANLCALVRDIARRHANGRLALILEGGYNLAALARSVRRCVEVLTGAAPRPLNESNDSGAPFEQVIKVQCDYHRRYWPL